MYLLHHAMTTLCSAGMRAPMMNDMPVPSMAFWFALVHRETIPASATRVASGRSRAAVNASMVGIIVRISARAVNTEASHTSARDNSKPATTAFFEPTGGRCCLPTNFGLATAPSGATIVAL